MTEKAQNPHDQFFKEIFSQQGSIVDFIENYVPERLSKLFDLPTLERIEDSFVDNELKFNHTISSKGKPALASPLSEKSTTNHAMRLKKNKTTLRCHAM